jgi:hypothetical protein
LFLPLGCARGLMLRAKIKHKIDGLTVDRSNRFTRVAELGSLRPLR